jgi:hypothetical protein
MTILVSKFSGNLLSLFIFISITLICLGFASYFYLNSSNQYGTDYQQVKENLFTSKKVEETDVVIPHEIIKMVELPNKQQIKIKTIQRDLETQKAENNSNNSNQEKITIDPLPTSGLKKLESSLKPERKQEVGKEIYLHNVKLIDYRVYRSKPQIKSKQLVFLQTLERTERMNDIFSRRPQLGSIKLTPAQVEVERAQNWKKQMLIQRENICCIKQKRLDGKRNDARRSREEMKRIHEMTIELDSKRCIAWTYSEKLRNAKVVNSALSRVSFIDELIPTLALF